jgi:hypothetical protein
MSRMSGNSLSMTSTFDTSRHSILYREMALRSIGPSHDRSSCHKVVKERLRSKGVKVELFIAEKEFEFTEAQESEK